MRGRYRTDAEGSAASEAWECAFDDKTSGFGSDEQVSLQYRTGYCCTRTANSEPRLSERQVSASNGGGAFWWRRRTFGIRQYVWLTSSLPARGIL